MKWRQRTHAAHLLSHGSQQLSEAAILLTDAGHSPGEIAFLEFLEQTGRRS